MDEEMRTVKEVADLTGVSVRILHYYDEIGLLKPSGVIAAGYRLYGTDKLEELRQILMEAYGSKEGVIKAAANPPGQEGVEQMQRQTDAVCRRLVRCRREGLSEASLEVKLLVCEYALAMKTGLRLENERQVMLGMADTYDSYEKAREALDGQYEEPGLAAYLVRAIRSFYR